MTPKEMAEWLHDKYFNVELAGEEAHPMERVTYLHAKACAIICVEQIIEAFKAGIDNPECTTIHIVHYWQDVLDILKAS